MASSYFPIEGKASSEGVAESLRADRHLCFACGGNGSVVRALEPGMRTTAQWALTEGYVGTSKETNVLTTLFCPRATERERTHG